MDDDLLKDFVSEAREHLTTIEVDLLAIEEGGANINEELVNKVFRAAHSIKGASGFFGLNKVKELSHKAETVLDMIRSRKMAPNAEVTNLLLAAFDKLRDMINHVEESEQADIAELIVSLTGLASSYLPPAQKASVTAQVKLNVPSCSEPVTLPQTDLDRIKRLGQYVYWVDCDLVHDIEKKGQNILAMFRRLSDNGEILDCIVDYDAVGTLDGPPTNRIPLRLIVATATEPKKITGLFETIDADRIHLLWDSGSSAITPNKVAEASVAPVKTSAAASPVPAPMLEVQDAPATVQAIQTDSGSAGTSPAKNQEVTAHATSSDETLRVNVGLLETLMNLAGELVLGRNQLRAAVAQNNRQFLATVDQRINQVTSELQDVIMQTRLQPIGNVFSKFPRVVRDLSKTLNKDIELEILGKDVALDKTLIEGLSDPLTHMVRNAVDHGIENTQERISSGKKPSGTVRIEARHEAGQVVVEIADDGKGIDPQRVADAAVKKGLISAERAGGLSDRDKQALIFLPGLSTAVKVSDVSGRGVGMDVVKTNLDRLGGQVEIVSEQGKGSTFRIKLPLTLAIIPSLIVSVENERFAIPQANIEELLRLRPQDVKDRIEIVGDSEVLLLRDRMLPLARFGNVLGIVPTYPDSGTGRKEIDRRSRLADRRSPQSAIDGQQKTGVDKMSDSGGVNQRNSDDRRQSPASAIEIAVVTTGNMSYGLVVDSFHDTEEVVVKPLGRRLKHLREYSGATILGDGTVALILDMAGLAAKAKLTSLSGSARAAAIAAKAQEQKFQDIHSLLIFHNGRDEQCAIPLDLVQRIERISRKQVERLGGQRAMQYRGSSLPLVALSDAAKVKSLDDEEDMVVLVTSANGREIGLLGSMPVDVIETRTTIDQVTHRQKGIAGSTILHDRTTLIADLYELVDAVHPDWIQSKKEKMSASSTAAPADATTVLLAEDSDFFRAQVKKYIQDDGYNVLAAPDGEAAWQLLVKNINKVKVVVTDIEMPHLNGLELTARIRGDQRTAGLPVIAVSSLAGDEDVARGKAAGVTDYQVKLDRDKLLSSIHLHVQGDG